jgi:hypothetical protein
VRRERLEWWVVNQRARMNHECCLCLANSWLHSAAFVYIKRIENHKTKYKKINRLLRESRAFTNCS